jgi:transposase
VLGANTGLSAVLTADVRARLSRMIHRILAPCRYPLHTTLLEGIVHKTKLITRIAYGLRDHEYFLLSVGAGFPRNVR